MKEKVIITGGAGFIGSHIVDACFEGGYDVHIIDNLSGGKKERINKKVIFHEVDIRDLNNIKPVIKGAKYVFHTAALPRVQYSIENPQETNWVNVGGTVNVLIAASEGNVGKVIYSASSSVYGDPVELPLKEDMPVNPKSPYGLHKYIGELYMKVWSEVYNLSTVSLRYFNVYGPRFDPDGAYALVIGKFLKQRKNGEVLTITGDGTQTRDFTHVSDVVRANLLAAECNDTSSGEVFNIGFGERTSINDIAALIGGETKHIDSRLEPHDTEADNTKALKCFNWEPKVTLEDGIRELKKEFGV